MPGVLGWEHRMRWRKPGASLSRLAVWRGALAFERRRKKVTEAAVAELMLEAVKVAWRNGNALGHVVPIANDV